MTETPKKRIPVWKFLSLGAAVLLLLLGSAALWIRSAAERRYAAMQETLRSMAAEALRPDTARRPGAEAGDAWDDYILALTESGKLKQAEKLAGILAGTPKADPAFGEAALATHGSVVDHLIRGSRRVSCARLGPAAIRGLSHRNTAVQLALLKARQLRKEGKTAEAIEIHLALCQFGRDLGESSGWPIDDGLRILEMAFGELRADLDSAATTPTDIAEIDSRLALLDDSFPHYDRVRRERIMFVGDVVKFYVQETGVTGSLLSWRYGCSSRLMAATGFENWDRWVRRAMEADRLPWRQAQPLISAIRVDIDTGPLLPPFGFSASSSLADGSSNRSTRAHLLLLRAAAGYRRTGKVLDWDDPFGNKLHHQESRGRLKVWSVGFDGLDEGGKGGWETRATGDIVLEVPR